MTVAENIVLATEPRKAGVFLDYAAADRRVRERSPSGFGFADRSRREGRRHHSRPAAARRDPEGALPQGQRPDPRRADRCPHASGGDGALRDPEDPSPPGHVDHLHHPQVERGARDRGSHHRPPARKEDRDGRPREGATEAGARPPHGGARGAVQSREVDSEPGCRDAPGGRRPGKPTTEVSRRFAGSSLPCSRRDRRALPGVDGNGQSELVEVLSGLRRPSAGAVRIAGSDATGAGVKEILDLGVGHIPEDRQRRGLVLDFSLAENLALHDYEKPPNARFGWLFPPVSLRTRRDSSSASTSAEAEPPDACRRLSGGNQQKVVLAREISREPQRTPCGPADARARCRCDRVRTQAAGQRA